MLRFLLACLCIMSAVGCQRGPSPGLEPQAQDYAEVRGQFKTKLTKKGPAPQQWAPTKPPKGVTEVEYASGDLKLKAWVNLPKVATPAKPAVLFLHGGWAFGEDDWEMAQPFRDAGYVVMTPLLRGENGQPGSFSMFYDEVDDVLAAADALSKLPGVDPKRIYLAGHSAGGTLVMLAAMTSDRFRAAVSMSGSPDRISFVKSGYENVVPFDQSDIREFQVRSPIAYATSFKCPVRLYYGSGEPHFAAETQRTAELAKQKGLDVEAASVPGDHFSSVPGAMKLGIAFFQQR